MNDILIVLMNERHIKAIAELERQCFSDPWSEDSLREELKQPFSVFLVAESDGEVAGYAGAQHLGDCAYICNVAVSPAFRRKGIALRLVREHIRRAAEAGMSEITLEVRTSNQPARELYEKCGFEQIGARPGFYSDPKENAEIYTKNLLKKHNAS